MTTFCTARAAAVFISIGVFFVALTGRVAWLQTYGREQTIRKAERQQHENEPLFARRGSIFDSTGMLMAGTVQTQTLFADPKFMQDEDQKNGHSLVELDDALAQLAKLIDKDPLELSQLMGDRYESRFVRLADHLDEQTCAAIEKLKLPGLGMAPMDVRYYPMGSIGAHVLGDVGGDGKGLEGLELKYESLLAGRDGYERALKDARRRPIGLAQDDYCPAQNGRHLVLTIDSNIQMITEQELASTCEQFTAKRGEAIVMDPKTGDILAMANWPTFNPQNLDDSPPEVRRNRCVTDPYEPGSTIKPFIAGPAMMWNVTRPDEVWPVHGPTYITPYGRHVTDIHPYAELAMWDVLVKSSNIGMSMLGERLGNAQLRRALAGFDFGQPTGVELPGEAEGVLHPLKAWSKYSTESISQGYELMVTPMQLCRAMCAYGNGGRLVTPHIIKGILDPEGGGIEPLPVAYGGQPAEVRDAAVMPSAIDPMTAAQMKRILCDVVIRGTAEKARSRTWNIFGKTGTAHITKGGSYSEQAFNSSFVGGAPAESPALIVAFIVHEPDRQKGHYGGVVSAPGAMHVLERSLAYLQVPSSPDLPVPPPNIANVLYAYDASLYTNRLVNAGD
jgi:cell division protein FtsI (penicillin-binding protein 3)